jgi:desulfoferrodoxin (superoxide reductase-like protein)
MSRKVLFLILSFVFVGVSSVFAHPPTDIKISFDNKTKILKAEIIHPVSNPQKHYIYKVDVSINDKEVISQTMKLQADNNAQTVQYLLPDVAAGDKVSVEGYCNLSGKLEKEMKVN